MSLILFLVLRFVCAIKLTYRLNFLYIRHFTVRRLRHLRFILLNGLYNLKFLRLLIFEIVPRSEIFRSQLRKNAC